MAQSFEDTSSKIIHDIIKNRVEAISEEIIADAKATLEITLKQEVDKMVLSVLRNYDISQNCHELVIKVRSGSDVILDPNTPLKIRKSPKNGDQG